MESAIVGQRATIVMNPNALPQRLWLTDRRTTRRAPGLVAFLSLCETQGARAKRLIYLRF
jgi:hypothetical protein